MASCAVSVLSRDVRGERVPPLRIRVPSSGVAVPHVLADDLRASARIPEPSLVLLEASSAFLVEGTAFLACEIACFVIGRPFLAFGMTFLSTEVATSALGKQIPGS
jgi:hypothetical protein